MYIKIKYPSYPIDKGDIFLRGFQVQASTVKPWASLIDSR